MSGGVLCGGGSSCLAGWMDGIEFSLKQQNCVCVCVALSLCGIEKESFTYIQNSTGRSNSTYIEYVRRHTRKLAAIQN